MPNADPNLPLRLALSHRAKAHETIEDYRRRLAQGKIDQGAFNAAQVPLEQELARAEATVAKLREVEKASIGRLETKLTELRKEQAALPQLAARGKLTPRGANDANRSLMQRIRALESGIASAQNRLAAQRAEEIGGRVDLPFERYMGDVAEEEAPSTGTVEWLASFAIAMVAAAAVFLPWVNAVGGASLPGLGKLPADAFTHALVPQAVLAFLWLAYLILPFMAPVLCSLRAHRTAAWCLLVLGMIVCAAGAMPPLLLGMPKSVGPIWTMVSGLYGIGAMVYVAAGVGLIVLAALRISPLTDTLWHSTVVALGFAGVAGAIVLAILAAVYWMPGVGRVEFSAKLRSPAQDAVVVTCRNNGSESASLYIPWPDVPEQSRPHGSSDFGVDVYVREHGQTDFRFLPNTRSAWNLTGGGILEAGPMRIGPGLTEEVTLDLRTLLAADPNAEAVGLAFGAGNGRAISRIDIDLPKQPLPARAAPTPVRPSPGQQIRAPKPSAPKPTTPKPGEPGVAPPAPTPVKPSPPVAPVTHTTITFSGTLGEKAMLKVGTGTGTNPGRIQASEGDTVVKGWVLEKLQSAPSAVVLRNTTTNAQVTIKRGETGSVE